MRAEYLRDNYFSYLKNEAICKGGLVFFLILLLNLMFKQFLEIKWLADLQINGSIQIAVCFYLYYFWRL
jgi:hypothetical protein